MSQTVDTSGNNAQTKSVSAAMATPEGQQRYWINEITVSEKETKDWHSQGRKITKKFIDDRDALDKVDRKFNIFTSNVEILQSALYAQIPKIEVSRRFDDMKDQVAVAAADMIQRMIEVDLNCEGNDFDRTMMNCVENRLIPGAGFAWLRYEPKVETVEIQDPATGEPVSYQDVTDHYVRIDYVYWEDFLWSPCRTWEERRWVGRRVYMSYDALVKRFGEEKAQTIPLDYTSGKGDTDSVTPENESIKQSRIYEIWDRESRRVFWIHKSVSAPLDVKDDFLGLEGFEPCPRPLFARCTTSRFLPVPDYHIIQDQYEELNIINNRISLLTAACKVVGAYDRGAEGVQRMLIDGTENTLVPVDNWAMFAEKGGIKGCTDWLPLDNVVGALEKLQFAAERLKQQIYEISGISDIMRGSSSPYEALGSQQIKAQFASARLSRMQNEISRFAGEILSLKAEIMLRHFPAQFIRQKSNIDQTMTPPQLVDAAMQLIDNEEVFQWRVKILPDSMAQIDYAQEKAQRNEFIGAVAGFLQNAFPAMQAQPALVPFLAALLKFGVGGFKNSQGLEAVLDQYVDQMVQQSQQPKPPSPEQQKAQMEQQKMQSEMQIKQQEHQMYMQQLQADLVSKQREHEQQMAFELAKHQQEMEFEREKNQQAVEMKQIQMQLDALSKLFLAKAEAASEPEEPEETGVMQ